MSFDINEFKTCQVCPYTRVHLEVERDSAPLLTAARLKVLSRKEETAPFRRIYKVQDYEITRGGFCMEENRGERFERYLQDEEAFIHMITTSPCFICRLVAGTYDEGPMHVLYEDDMTIAFLEKWPRLYGHTLVASREHREQITSDFTIEEYLALHQVVYRVAEAIRQEVKPERLYIFAFGSQQAIAHVHWHIVPLPPGVPFREQQAAIFRQGVLNIPEDEMTNLKNRIIQRIKATS